jgi:hypothetical protein
VVAWPVWPGEGRVGAAIHCRGKDVSLNGARFLSPVEPPSALLRVQLGPDGGSAVETLARVVRVEGGAAGFEVAAQFCDAPASCWSDAPPADGPAAEISPVF